MIVTSGVEVKGGARKGREGQKKKYDVKESQRVV
jgi:hypothetical protein